MKGFYQYLSPFAPDYSGASGVLYDAGGLIVICDPGGCSGIVCGYDEPRFFEGKTPLYSAALRDADTIFGRDEDLQQKVIDAAAEDPDIRFIALIPGPVETIIGTDLSALSASIEKSTGIPCFSVTTTGMALYDSGEFKAYKAFIDKFSKESENCEKNSVILFGALPLDLPGHVTAQQITDAASAYYGCHCIGFGSSLSVPAVENASYFTKAAACSVQGLKAARYFAEKNGIDAEIFFPDNDEFTRISNELSKCRGAERVLIIHDQVCAGALRERLQKRFPETTFTVGSFFETDDSLTRPGDLYWQGEDEFVSDVKNGGFQVITADPFYMRPFEDSDIINIGFPQCAVSGDYYL
jgi:hypothetical protein